MHIPCPNCGNLLQIEPNVSFLACNKCKTPLQLQQNASTSFLSPYQRDTDFETAPTTYNYTAKTDLYREIEMLDKAWEIAKRPAGQLSMEDLSKKLEDYPVLEVLGLFGFSIVTAIIAVLLAINVSEPAWIMPTIMSVATFIGGILNANLYSSRTKQLTIFKKKEKEYLKQRAALKKRYDAL